MSDMPARCAAAGSFHVKSDTTYFITVLVTVRVLPFFLIVTLIRSDTLIVSILGVRSYSDQRYPSMQMSATHSWGDSIERTGGFGPSSTGSEVGTDASCMPVSGGPFGPASAKTGSAAGASAAEEPAEAKTGSGEFESPAPASLTEVGGGVTTRGWGGVG